MNRIASLAAVLALALTQDADAQTTFPGTFTVTPDHGTAPLTVTLSWNVPGLTGATPCTASGSWTGAKAASGTQTVTSITANATYTLSCTTTAVPGSARLTWVAPTQNTDGTPVAGLAGYRLNYGRTADALTNTVQIATATATSHTITPLADGTWFFAARAYTTAGAESALSNVVSKTVSGTAAQTFTVARTVVIDKVPQPPVLTVVEPTAYRIAVPYDDLRLVRVGTVPVGTPCAADKPALGMYLVKRARVRLDDGIGLPNVAVAKCAPSIQSTAILEVE